MKYPEKMIENNLEYNFVKEYEHFALYEREGNKYKRCFDLYDCGLIKKRKNMYNIKPEDVSFWGVE